MSIDIPQIISTDGDGLCYNKYEVSNFPTDGSEFQNLDYVVILGVKFSGFSNNFAGYFMKIYYNSTLIFDTGNSTATRGGNPVNWPPPQNAYGTETIGPGNRQVKSAELVSSSSTLLGAAQDFYILPDIQYESIKNETTFPNNNTTIENTIQAGSHFALGSHQSTIKIEGDQIEPSLKSYYGITKLSSPPTIYRNTLAVDDGGLSSGSDQDFNDAIFVLKKGDGFFTGKTTIAGGLGTGSLGDEPYSYPGNVNQNWSKTYNTFVANTTGRYEFQVKRDAGRKNKILLHPGTGTGTASGDNGGSSTLSSNWAIIEPGGNPSTVNVTLINLQAGTYEVALRSNNATREEARLHVRHIDINKYPTLRPST